MTIERMAKAIAVLSDALSGGDFTANNSLETQCQMVEKELRSKHPHPDIQRSVDVIMAVTAAYLGDDMEAYARELIIAVAATNRAKRIQMFVVDGKGIGPWECIVRRNREDATPSFLTKLILPTGYKQ